MLKTISKWILLSCLCFSAPAIAEEVDEESRDQVHVIHAGQLLAIPGEVPLQQQSIIVRNDRIERIVAGYVEMEAEEGADISVIDMRNMFVLPGLMDMHVHLSFESGQDSLELRGTADEIQGISRSQRADVIGLIEAIGHARETVMAGYTTVRNVGSNGWHIGALREAINEGRLDGPRILTSFHTIYPGSDDGPGACSGVESCRRAARSQIDMGADLIKVYATCSGSRPCGRQNAPSIFIEDELDAIVAVARSRQVRVAAHAHGEEGILTALHAGVDSIEHGSYNTPESHAIFRANGAFLVPTLSVQDNIREDIVDATGSMHDVMQNFLDNHGPRMIAAYRVGVRIAAGSDAGVTQHGNNARELEFYVREGMPASDAIVAATVHGAALINRSDDLGTIEVGKIADIIAVATSPLDDITALQNVEFVMANGHIVKCEAAHCSSE